VYALPCSVLNSGLIDFGCDSFDPENTTTMTRIGFRAARGIPRKGSIDTKDKIFHSSNQCDCVILTIALRVEI
jgi:hypothetical protein